VVALQSVAPGNSRLAFLSTQLQRERERIAAEENRRLSAEARAEKLRDALREANERLRRGALLEPANDSAQSHYQTALDLAPNDPEVRALRTRLASRLLETAGQRLDSNEIPAARGMLDAAGNLGADPVALRNLRRRADELTAAAVARASVPVPAPAAAPPATVAPATAVTPAAQSPAPAASAPQTSPETAAPRDDEPYDTIRIYAPSELKIVRRQEVEYPSRAIRERLGGWVDVEFTITPEGAVRNIIVLRAEPRNVFENSAIQALRRWRYEPVKENGKAIEARTRMRLRIPAPTVE
jgi:protein TonB